MQLERSMSDLEIWHQLTATFLLSFQYCQASESESRRN